MNLAIQLNDWWISQIMAGEAKTEAKRILNNKVPRGVQILRERGWTYRTAAKHLGVTFQHLHRVARDERISARLNRKIAALPNRKGGAK